MLSENKNGVLWRKATLQELNNGLIVAKLHATK